LSSRYQVPEAEGQSSGILGGLTGIVSDTVDKVSETVNDVVDSASDTVGGVVDTIVDSATECSYYRKTIVIVIKLTT